ncbi:unnamed protein product [Urochloa humidicola]
MLFLPSSIDPFIIVQNEGKNDEPLHLVKGAFGQEELENRISIAEQIKQSISGVRRNRRPANLADRPCAASSSCPTPLPAPRRASPGWHRMMGDGLGPP